MGASQNKKQRFLAAHPFCCFCGGINSATTIDHVPNRACFKDRLVPEGYEFPACISCQQQLRQHEQFFAFFCQLSEQGEANYSSIHMRKLFSGIANNLPGLLPKPISSRNNKRRALKHLGFQKPNKIQLKDIPLVSFTTEIDLSLKTVTMKLGLALFYKHKNKSAPATHNIAAYWSQSSIPEQREAFIKILSELPNLEIGTRKNIKYEKRFAYRWNDEEEGSSDIFIVVVQFGTGLTVCSMIVDQVIARQDNETDWITVSDLASGSF